MQVPKMSHSSYLQQLQQVSQLFLALLTLWSGVHASGKGVPVHVYTEVGENFTFTFPVGPDKILANLYLQFCTPDCNKESNTRIFVNGFYKDKEVKDGVGPQFINRTSFNRSRLTVTIWGIRVEDEGNYEWTHQDMSTEIHTHLHVSAKYKTPTLTVISCWPASGHQEGGFGDHGDRDIRDSVCMLACTSHGGYPYRKVEWGGPVTQNTTQFKPINDSQEEDPDTLLFTSSSTAQVSCSMEQQSLICSVGGSPSRPVNVCEAKGKTPAPFNWNICIVAVLIVLLVGTMVLFRKWIPTRVGSETGVGGNKEDVPLKENGTEKEA